MNIFNRKASAHWSRCVRALVAFHFMLIMSSAANAVGNVEGTTVVNVDVRSDGYFLITFSRSSTTPPGCASVANRMSGNANTAGGRAVLAAAMLAYANQSPVNLAQGTGTCNEYAGIESVMILQQGN